MASLLFASFISSSDDLSIFYAALKLVFSSPHIGRNRGAGALSQCKNRQIRSIVVQPFGAADLYRRMTTTVTDPAFSRRRLLHGSRRARRPLKGEHQHMKRDGPAAGRSAKRQPERPGGVFAGGLVCVE
jgi:hypothetical protein